MVGGQHLPGKSSRQLYNTAALNSSCMQRVHQRLPCMHGERGALHKSCRRLSRMIRAHLHAQVHLRGFLDLLIAVAEQVIA